MVNMIESTIRSYLEDRLHISVYTEKETKMPASYLLIEKTGGSSDHFIHKATIAVKSIAPSMAKASELNEKVKGSMFELSDLTNISRCDLNSDYNFTDQETKEYRYQAVFDITYM